MLVGYNSACRAGSGPIYSAAKIAMIICAIIIELKLPNSKDPSKNVEVKIIITIFLIINKFIII